MKTVKAVIESEVVSDESGKHRYSFKRVWDAKKPILCVITIYPTNTSPTPNDITTMRIESNILAMPEYGGYTVVNLFSALSPEIRKDSLIGLLRNSDTDKYIREAAEQSEAIVISWGRIADTNPIAAKRRDEVMALLKKQTAKLMMIEDFIGRTGLHPLTPSAKVWAGLVPYKPTVEKRKAEA